MPETGFIMETDNPAVIRLIQVVENNSVGLYERVAAYGELKRLNVTTDGVDKVGRELLEEAQLSQQLNAVDPPFQVGLLCIYTLAAFLSITGNLIVIIVLRCGKRSSIELRAFLVNLAVADVTMAVFSIPFTYTIYVWGHWMFIPSFCPVAILMQHVAVVVSVYTLTVIGFDRYKAILYPFETRFTKTRTKSVIVTIWVAAFGISSIQLVVTKAEPFENGGQIYMSCEEKWWDSWQYKAYTIFIFVLTFFVPLLGILVAYCAIARRLFEHNAPGNADRNRDQVQLKAKRKVIKMLFTIVALFALCWFPLQVYNLLFFFVPNFGRFRTNYGRHVYALSYLGCHWLANANSFVNPLVYCFMSDNFRADLRDLLNLPRRRCRYSESQPLDRTGSTRGTTDHRVDCCLELNGISRLDSGGTTRLIPTPQSTSSAVSLSRLYR